MKKKTPSELQPPAHFDVETTLPLRPTQGERASLSGALKVFATGLTGGVISLFSLTGLPAKQVTRGATRGLQIDRQRQQRCLELGITPEELAVVEAREALARGTEPE